MARTLDFSPIDYRQALLADPAGKAIAGAIQGLGETAAETIQERRRKAEEREADFVEQMKYDTAITGNNIVNSRIAQEYNGIKNKWVDIFDQRKGRLTPSDKINMRSDLQALDKLANSFKTAVTSYEQAKNMALRDKGTTYNLDNQKWADLMTLASGKGTTGDLLGFMTNLNQSNTEIPFLNYNPINPSLLESQALKNFKSRTAEEGTKYTTTQVVDGREVKRESQQTTYGDPDQLINEMITTVAQKGGPGASLFIQQQLTDNEKMAAVDHYGNNMPFIKYYYRDKMRNQLAKELQPKREAAVATRPEKRGGGIMINFGGGKEAPKGALTPQDDVVEGVPVKGYIEVAKARPSIKTVKGVTVKGAQLLSDGEVSPAENLTTPRDYEVLGVSVDSDEILLRQKILTKNGVTVYRTYKVPREGNEHFLSGLFSEETIREMETRSVQADQTKKDPLGIL
jgi:hypothetical protein